MKAEELMLSDIVRYNYGGEWFNARVKEVYQDSVLVEEIAYEYEPIEIPESLIEPIPLTPEILEKNGFKPGIISWILWDEETDECLIMLKRINNAFIFPPLAGMSFGIQFVHELQRLFRLGWIKKQIVI